MNCVLRNDAEKIARGAVAAVVPDAAVRKALQGRSFGGRLYLVSVGKAAWKMAAAALSCLAQPAEKGIVITKYGHAEHPLPGIICHEAGHPVPDENSFRATREALEMTADLHPEDTVLFLLSGGGSALFEEPLIPAEELWDITSRLLSSGADIAAINTIRKRLSAVKGGRFAQWCAPAHVESIILSDVLGDAPDMIASGPAVPDCSTCEEALAVVKKYGLTLSERAWELLHVETPNELPDASFQIIGSVRQLCSAACVQAALLGYEPILLTDSLNCEARDAGIRLGKLLRAHAGKGRKLAFIAGGETVVLVKGNGLGGRNQELALAAAESISGIPDACIISIGSDGTDGPTDAAGGYADGDTARELTEKGIKLPDALANNDSYHALCAIDALIFTGPTGTNVNDVSIALLR